MSSDKLRTDFETFLLANTSEKVADLTDEFDDLFEFLTSQSIGRNDDWVGLQYIGNDELPVGLNADNSTGRYRETGSVFLHVVTKARNDSRPMDNLRPRLKTLRELLRGRRIVDIIITGVSPPNFESGATLQFEGGFQSASFIVNYYMDINL